ncbi:MAG: Glu/Leu/Phe/Val dehydrogenase dimerization domain-containing protein [Gemmatimonadota bacterium]
MLFDHPEFDAHERVLHVSDAPSSLRAIIAIHRGRGGTAAGGVRFRPYPSEADALTDVLRLSRAMTYKNVLADLPLGGAKSVILGDPATDKNPDLLRAFGRIVESLGGAYMCGPDIGTTADDMDVIAEETDHVGATNKQMGSSGPPTALGVFHGIRAVAEHVLGSADLAGVRVAVQGAGAVGSDLAVHLVEAGARVTVADVDAAAVRALRERTTVDVATPEDILFLDADILSPCALGAVLSEETIARLRVKGICGGANNQLATEADGERLRARGIALVPDFVASAGGVIAGTAAAGLYPQDEMQGKLDGIQDRALAILRRADTEGRTPHEVAHEMAEELLAAGS